MSDSKVRLLNYLTEQINFYCPIIIILIGTIGCFCNFLTFSSKKLRENSCSLYFLCASIFDLFTLDFGLLTLLLGGHFGLILYQQSTIYCKIRQYLVTVLPAFATCFIVLAAMDRYLSTSSKLLFRSYATIKSAPWIIAISLLICSLSYIHYPIYVDLRPTCSLPSGTYGIFAVIYSIVWTGLLPHILMLVFGFTTQYHVRTTRRRIVPLNQQQRRIQRTEFHLIKMMLFQVGISSILILTRICYFSYSIITTNLTKNDYEIAFGTFFSQLTTQLFYLNYAKSFYIYTLFSKYFRRIFFERISKFSSRVIRKLTTNSIVHRQNIVQPRNHHNTLTIVPATRIS